MTSQTSKADKVQKINIALSGHMLEHEDYTGKDGLYMSATPDDAGKYRIIELCEKLGFETDAKALHCTLVYSREKAPAVEDLPQTRRMSGLINEVKHWVGHDKLTYIVAGVVSTDVHWAHANLIRAGAEHSFIPFVPHITLTAGKPVGKAMQAKIDAVNKELNRDPINITLERRPPSNIVET